MLAGLMGAALFSGSAGPIAQVSRLLGSAASLGEAAADTGTRVLVATSDMASSLSSLASTAASTSLALSATAWRGVDVLQVRGVRCDGMFAVDAPELVFSWLSAPYARKIAPCVDEHLIAFAAAVAEAIDNGIPVLEQSAQELDVLGDYGELHASASLAATGHIMVRYCAINLSFSVQWSNPLWDTLDFPVSQEKAQILEQLQSAKQMLPVRVVNWNAEESIAYHAPTSVRLTAAWKRWVRSWCLCLGHLFQLLGFNTWNGWGALAIFGQTCLLIYYALGPGVQLPHLPVMLG